MRGRGVFEMVSFVENETRVRGDHSNVIPVPLRSAHSHVGHQQMVIHDNHLRLHRFFARLEKKTVLKVRAAVACTQIRFRRNFIPQIGLGLLRETTQRAVFGRFSPFGDLLDGVRHIVFEQRGCIYCANMHEKLLSDPEVRDFIEANFKVVQYNMFGDEEVTDLDGETLSEKTAARKWGVVFTPTIIFLPEEAPEGKTVADAAVATMPGAFGKWTFLHMFQWVSQKGYETDEHFQKFHARMLEEGRAAGRLDLE